MYKATLITDTDILDAHIETAKRLPLRTASFVERVLKPRLADDMLAELDTEPSRIPDLPFVWSFDPVKQARARRYYFAVKVGKGKKGGRYIRTGRLVAGWQIDVSLTANEGLISVFNPARGAEYVIGSKQVPSHERTGWYQADDVVIKYSEIAQDELIDFWYKETGAR